jgi:Alcohol dehydrogenase, class IV
VVRDTQVAALNLGSEMIAGLAEAGFEPTLFDGITSEPTLEMARAVLGQAREYSVVAVVGLGGGSCMDMAKLGAAFAREPHSVEAVVENPTLTSGALPLALIPTTAGTGSEASRVSMLSVDGHKRILVSQYFMPLAAVLDPDLIQSLPPSVTASSGLDALAHAFEAFISTNATTLTDTAARSAIGLLAPALPRAYHDGSDHSARAQTLTAAHLAGCSLNASVTLGHSIAYTIASRTRLPHGITAGMALPYSLAYALPAVHGRLGGIASNLGVGASSLVEDLLRWLLDLDRQLGAATSLHEVGIGEDQLAEMATECVHVYPRPNNPVPLEQRRLTELLSYFHQGDLDGAIKAMSR